MKNFEVQTCTVVDGWVNCWYEGSEPMTYETEAEAQSAIDEFFDDLEPADMAGSYSRDDYRVAWVPDPGTPNGG